MKTTKPKSITVRVWPDRLTIHGMRSQTLYFNACDRCNWPLAHLQIIQTARDTAKFRGVRFRLLRFDAFGNRIKVGKVGAK